MSTPSVVGGGKAFGGLATAASVCPPPRTVGGGSHSLGLSLGGGEVHHHDPLYHERGLVP
jgi:hypothetical protein